MPFRFERLQIPDVVRIVPRVFPDERGAFWESLKRSDFAAFGIELDVVQVNESISRRGTLRGLHYQLPPHAQGKLVRVLAGAAWDVALDLREGSPTFGRHVAVELSADNRHLLWIPPGFAHGFCALEDGTHFLYLQDAEYRPEAERGVHPLDPALGIAWPLPAEELLLSAKDNALPPLAEANRAGFVFEGSATPDV